MMFIESAAKQTISCCHGTSAAIVLMAVVFGTPFHPVVADEAAEAGLAEAIAGGKAKLEFRYRLEHVNQDNFAEDADASTVRMRLNYETAGFHEFNGFVEFDYVADLLFDDYDSGGGTSPDRTQYPVVADPTGSDLNQVYVDYRGLDETQLRLGRQRILLDNQRFIGGVGWRQNEQTFDVVTISYDGWDSAVLQYSYVSRVNRIFGDKSLVGQVDGDIHLLHVIVPLPDKWMLAAYAYLIDTEDAPASSTATFGVRGNGELTVAQEKFLLAADIATQSDAGVAPISYRAEYWRFDAAWVASDDFSVGVVYEHLGGDSSAPGKSFRTPLATLHAFQGWADQFLSTPNAGVDDLFLSLSWKRSGWTLQTDWHWFDAADGGDEWGTELDLSLGRKLGARYGLLLKGAFFEAKDATFVDVNKYWLMLTANF
jgi:hypothetical protein